MSTAVFPTLAGLGWSITRSVRWSGRIQRNVSGKMVRISDYSYPDYEYEVNFNGGLRIGSSLIRAGDSYNDVQTLMAFISSRQGTVDSWLYSDQDDYTVTNQALGAGNGVQTAFQMLRSNFGGFGEPIYAPNVISQVRVAGTPTGAYSLQGWGTANPGVITFSSPPANGAAIAADFTFYWPCHFMDDGVPFEKKFFGRYFVKSLKFETLKGA
jgi:hypothetical protein